MNYEETVNYINNIPKFAGKNTLEDTRTILEALTAGSDSPKIIHVAGTNGKGSVCAFLNSILIAGEKKTGLFISPHLVHTTERIKINNEDISREDFVRAYENVLKAVEETNASHPSYFEFLFLMAMWYFAKNCCDYIILETGLGGRLDATNSVKNKILTVITEIGMDHEQYLGNTYEAIAMEKAGIIRENTPLVFMDKRPEATTVIRDTFLKNNSVDKLYMLASQDISNIKHTKKGIEFSLFGISKPVCIKSKAVYQCENASLAILAANALKDDGITEEHILTGIGNAFWPGRMQEIEKNIFIDGAHNEDGIAAFIEAVDNISCDSKRYLIFGVVSDKDYSSMIKKIACSDLFEKIIVTGIDSERSSSLDMLKKEFDKYPALDISYENNSKVAFELLKDNVKDDSQIFVAGSLYLIGEILALY